MRPEPPPRAATATASSADRASGFSTKQCLPACQHTQRQRGVRGNIGRDHHRVELGVGQQLVQVGGEARLRERRLAQRSRVPRSVAAPAQLAALQRGEVARQVRPPVAEPDDAHAYGPRVTVGRHAAAGSTAGVLG